MKNNSVKKIALNMYIEQMKWSVWFISILMIIYIALEFIGRRYNFEAINNILLFSAGSSMIYMFVIGIIAGATFLPQLAKLGVTRKHCFYGTVISAICLSVTLPLIFSLFSGLEYLLSSLLNLNVDSSAFTNFPVLFILYIFNTLVGYFLGWLINVGFYGFHWIVGLIFIVLAIVINSVYAFIWKNNIVALYSVNINLVEKNITTYSPIIDSSFLLSSLGTLGIILVILIIIRLLTKNISIKIK